MHPILLEIGPFVLPSWHVFFVLGAFAAFFFFRFSASVSVPVVEDRDVKLVYASAYLSGYFGARLLHILVASEHQGSLFLGAQALFSMGGMVFYGGMIGGVLGGIVCCLVRGLNFLRIMDLGLPSLFLALVLGRIGCFLNGDDYGIPHPNPQSVFAVVMPNLGDNIARYPVQLFESLIVAVCVFVTWRKLDYFLRKPSGYLSAVLIVTYGVFRFILEFFRGDERGWLVEGAISTSQGISIVMVLVGLGLLGYSNSQRRSPSSS